MADLISRDALLSKVKPAAIPEGSDYVTEHDVLFAPAVDAVEVVRCKDCKHYSWDNIFHYGNCNGKMMPRFGYCSCGERKAPI